MASLKYYLKFQHFTRKIHATKVRDSRIIKVRLFTTSIPVMANVDSRDLDICSRDSNKPISNVQFDFDQYRSKTRGVEINFHLVIGASQGELSRSYGM